MKGPRKWSEEEIQLLKKLYPNPDVSMEDLRKIFKNRSTSAIVTQANRLGLRRPVGGVIDYEYLKKLKEVHNI